MEIAIGIFFIAILAGAGLLASVIALFWILKKRKR